MRNRRLNLLQWKIPGDAPFQFAAICRNVELTDELQAVGLGPQDLSFRAAWQTMNVPMRSGPARIINA